ncbi:hypothetical protein H8356DRAFT_1351014 [Neocallimastix lanati (nom. inval.)]|nr:hypothetical protein H8356DRAFT_1351014 [Neocallimastix sp. JGI-2020a]
MKISDDEYTDNKLYGFGANQWGQLGLGHDEDVEVIKEIDKFKNLSIKHIICKNFNSYILTKENIVFSCGKNISSKKRMNTTFKPTRKRNLFYNNKLII